MQEMKTYFHYVYISQRNVRPHQMAQGKERGGDRGKGGRGRNEEGEGRNGEGEGRNGEGE